LEVKAVCSESRTHGLTGAEFPQGDLATLQAALQSIVQAADLEEDDGYNDAWKHWELVNIYNKMNKHADVQKHRKQWLQILKSDLKSRDNLSSGRLDYIAGKCLEIGFTKEALEYATKAVELESEPKTHAVCLVTLADTHRVLDRHTEAFNEYVEAFAIFTHEDAFYPSLRVLSKLALLVGSHPGFLDEAKRVKLNRMMDTIGNIEPSRFTGYSVWWVINNVSDIRAFCRALGDMSPLLKVIRGLLKEEPSPGEQLAFLSYLVTLNGGVSEFERNWLSSPEFIESITALDNSYLLKLGWVYEMIGEPMKAIEAYQSALQSEIPETRMLAGCALVSLRHNLGETVLSQPHLYFEAEEAVSFTPYLEIAQAPEASNGKYLWAPDTFTGSHDGKGEAEYTFEIGKPGTYRVVARMMGESSYANRIHVSIGESGSNLIAYWRQTERSRRPYQHEGLRKNAAWEWRAANKSFTLPAGKHRLVVHNKDDGVKLDCMVLYLEK